MKRSKFFSLFFFLVICGFLCHPPVSARVCNRIVAIVNNDMITLYELNSKIKELTGVDPADLRAKDETGYLEIRRNILDLMIDERIAREKIRELGIKVDPKEIDRTIENIKRKSRFTHEDLIASLRKQGIDYESYRDTIKKELERMRLINFEVKSKIIIREENVKEYYNRHKDDFTTEEKICLAVILLRQKKQSGEDKDSSVYEKAEGILLRLKSGEDFGELAKKYSVGPGANEGGNLGYFKISQLDSKLAEIINGMSPGDVSGPIIKTSGIQIVKLVDRHKRSIKPFLEVKAAIYDILYRDEINKRYSSWIKELREKAYTKIIF